jgi:periplasmic divalent cation tolerance protein
MTHLRLLYVTAPNRQEACSIARTVVEERLAACANILGDIETFYHWEGVFENGQEVAFLLKTTADREAALIERVNQLHSYSCPAIITLPLEGGFGPFLDWVVAETKPRV